MNFCGYCGSPLAATPHPRKCTLCPRITYANPIPVAALLLPVNGGLLLVKRSGTSEVKPGEWALPSGYMELGETWQEAAVRELEEETGIKRSANLVELFDAHSVDTGKLLLFGHIREHADLDLVALNRALCNSEVSELNVMRDPHRALAFPTHSLVAGKWFAAR